MSGDSAPSDAAADQSTFDASVDQVADTTLDQTVNDALPDTLVDVGADGTSTDGSTEAGGSDGGGPNPAVCAACPAGLKYCNEVCVSIDNPDYGCTPTSCAACPDMSSQQVATITCSAGACAIGRCYAGFADCDGNISNGCEADLQSRATCGSCAHACGASQVCDGTTCMSSCSFPKTSCGGACHDLSSDPAACGSCNNRCPSLNGTASCTAGNCGIVCDSGYAECGSATQCSTNLTDGIAGGCGKCGTMCGSVNEPYGQTAQCVTSTCNTGCVPGFTSCGSQCVDENSDPANCGSCNDACGANQICLNGACAPLSSMQVVTGLASPEDITLDANNIYWTDIGTNEVWQADKNTFAKTKLASNQAKPYRIAVDSQYVYWTSNLGGAILRAPIGGGSAFSVLYPASQPTAIAVDTSYVYWADTGSGNVYKAPKSGPDAGAPAALTGPTSCRQATASIPCTPDELKTDASNLYGWDHNAGVYRIDKTLGTLLNYHSWEMSVLNRGIAIDSSNVYWTRWETFNLVWLWGVDQANTRQPQEASLPTASNEGAVDMIADSCAVYWTDGTANVWRLPSSMLGGSFGAFSPMELTRAGTKSNRLTIDDTYVYWTDSGWIGRVLK